MNSPTPRTFWTGALIAGTLLLFLAVIVLALVPLTTCPHCFGSRVKDGIIPVSSVGATEAYAKEYPCLTCREWPRNDIPWLKRWLVSVRR